MSEANDPVNHPEHYTYASIECIDLIRELEGVEGAKSFCKGNAIKYIFRSKYKGREKEDIEKAIWYLNKWLELNDNYSVVYSCPDPNTGIDHTPSVVARLHALTEDFDWDSQIGYDKD